MAQRLNHLPAMQETWVWPLGQEDSLEKEMATHSSILAWRIPWTEEPGWATLVHGVAKSRTRLSDFTFFLSLNVLSGNYSICISTELVSIYWFFSPSLFIIFCFFTPGNYLLDARYCEFHFMGAGYFCILVNIPQSCFRIQLSYRKEFSPLGLVFKTC